MIKTKVRGAYDAGGYDIDNSKHWSYASGQSADATAVSSIRRSIRNKARYEVLENNSYGRGIVNTLAEDTIGTGPRLQLHTSAEAGNEAVEREFHYWMQASSLAEKLRVMKTAKTVDGEAVAKIVTNPPLLSDVKLDLQLVECDRLSSPLLNWDTPRYIDGVHLDEYGNARRYDILRQHPGNTFSVASKLLEFDTYERSQIVHWFKPVRPEQHRGVSEVVTALPLFAFMRRFTLATISAAETAANHAMVVESEGATPEENYEFETIELQRNLATFLPANHKLGQVNPQHPATTYDMFKAEVLNEVARCLSMPYNIAAANSSGYNYSSGRLDHQVYDRSLKVEQAEIERKILNRLLGEWLTEASLLGLLPASIAAEVFELSEQFGPEGVGLRIPHSWEWDKRPHVDPEKEAQAQRIRLQNGTTSRRHEMKEVGLNLDEIDRQEAADYGITLEQLRQGYFASVLTNGNFIFNDLNEQGVVDNQGEGETEEEESEQSSEA